MDKYIFHCSGHENVKGTHASTFEFTKDDFLTKEGDCIIGIKADFSLEKVKEFIRGNDVIDVIIECDGIKDEIRCLTNHKFNSDHEMVFRIGEFASERTLGVRAEKASKLIHREIIEKMKKKNSKMIVTLSPVK